MISARVARNRAMTLYYALVAQEKPGVRASHHFQRWEGISKGGLGTTWDGPVCATDEGLFSAARSAMLFRIAPVPSCLSHFGLSLLFSVGYPSPLFMRKMQKTKDLFCDYVLDL